MKIKKNQQISEAIDNTSKYDTLAEAEEAKLANVVAEITAEEENKAAEDKVLVETEEIEIEVKTDDEGKFEAPELIVDKIHNVVIDTLDEALDNARYFIKTRQYHQNCNVLITGLPGSSKTASINEWARENGIHLVKLDAKSPDLELLINGAPTVRDAVREVRDEVTDETVTQTYKQLTRAYSDALDKLKVPNTVLFLDELNRQVKEYLRGSLLTLLEERACTGPGEDGMVHFDNLLFTIAAINPAVKADKGVTQLMPAERRRFQYNITFDSTSASAKEYIKKHYDKCIVDTYKLYKGDTTNPDYQDEMTMWLKSQDLGLALLSSFEFDNSLEKYSNTYASGRKLLCQAAVTELIALGRGDKERTRKTLQKYAFLDDDQAMLDRALVRYTQPPVDKLAAAKEKELDPSRPAGWLLGTTVTAPTKTPTAVKAEKPEVAAAHRHEEDDDEFTTSKKATMSKEDRRRALEDGSAFDF